MRVFSLPATAIPVGPRKRVLAVDDDLEIREALFEFFTALGHEALCVGSGSEAITAFPTLRPELVVLDIDLPDMPGTEVARQLRGLATDHAVTIIALTGYTTQGDVERSLAAGVDVHIRKPSGFAVLRELLGDASEAAPAAE